MTPRTITGNSRKAGQMVIVPGWYGEPFDNGFTARRLVRLTDYQLSNGCLEEVLAADAGELWLLCDAQTRLAERIAVAEATRKRP